MYVDLSSGFRPDGALCMLICPGVSARRWLMYVTVQLLEGRSLRTGQLRVHANTTDYDDDYGYEYNMYVLRKGNVL